MQTFLKWLLGILGVAVVVTVIAVPLALLTGGESAAGPGGSRRIRSREAHCWGGGGEREVLLKV